MAARDMGVENLGFLGCWSWNAQTGAIYASRRLNHLFGLNLDLEGPEAMSAYERQIHPDDLEWLRRERARCFGPSGHGAIEYRVIDQAGEVRWVMCRAIYATDIDGEIKTAHGMVIDVTRMKADGMTVRTAPSAAAHSMRQTADMLIRAHEAAAQTANQQLIFQIEVALSTVGRALAWELTHPQHER